ncbi:MAG: hypothetical protein M5U01_01750 [Ardenticatenaceae bacterium]|nr:hypothetical protein [Ardenticatenaceae bacterium]
MRFVRTLLSNRFLVVAILLLLGLTPSSYLLRTAQAVVIGCRADPIVYLSNGEQIRMTTNIDADASDVRSILYTIHVPTGVSVTRVVYTGGALAAKEAITFYDDQPPYHYATETLVRLQGKNVDVAARMAMRSLIQSVSGLSGQPLAVEIWLDQ